MRNDNDTPKEHGYARGRGHGRHGQDWEGRHGGREDRRGDAAGTERRGRWGGHGHHGGRGGRPRVGKGDVRAAILLLLEEEPLHGYQLIHRIEERSGGLWRPSPGSVYPALQLLEDEGLVRPEQEEGRRVFHLTDTGTAYVRERRPELEAARDAVTGRVNPRAQTLQELVHQLTVAVDQVAQVGTSAQLDATQQTLVATRRQLYRILADDLPAAEQPNTTTTKGGDAHV
jgi:DNA-binding PadR family transcriptional regulator